MGWQSKLTGGGLGLAVFFAGLAIRYNNLKQVPVAILLIMTGILLLGQVAWKALINKKLDDKDLMSIIAIVLGFFVLIAGIGTLVSVSLAAWILVIVPWAVALVGIFIIVQALLM